MAEQALTRSSLKRVVKKLEQTAVAVSVMSTTRRKMKEMVELVEPVADALVGSRPEVDGVRLELKRLMQNARVSNVRARPAAERLRALARGVEKVQTIVGRGMGDVDSSTRQGDFTIVNTWGYTDSEAKSATRALDTAARKLARVGLPVVVGGMVELDPVRAKRKFVSYDGSVDELVFDPKQSSNDKQVLSAFAERLWAQEFAAGDIETWGGKGGLGRFQEAFAAVLDGDKVDADTTARLQVTVGKMATRWPGLREAVDCLPSDLSLFERLVYKIGKKRKWNDGQWHVKVSARRWVAIAKGHRAEDPKTRKRQRKEAANLAGTVRALEKMVKSGGLAKGMSLEAHVRESGAVRKKHRSNLKAFKNRLALSAAHDKGHEVKARLKEQESVLGKLIRKPKLYKRPNDLQDVTGTRIIHDTVDQVKKTVENLVRDAVSQGMKVEENDDLISNPQGPAKYRSIHMTIVDKDGLAKEVQIRTRNQDKFGDWAHDTYKPTKASQKKAIAKAGTEINRYAARMSDHFYAKDTGKKVGKLPPCPPVVRINFGCL